MPIAKRDSFTQDQVYLIDRLNLVLLDLHHELEGFDDSV